MSGIGKTSPTVISLSFRKSTTLYFCIPDESIFFETINNGAFQGLSLGLIIPSYSSCLICVSISFFFKNMGDDNMVFEK